MSKFIFRMRCPNKDCPDKTSYEWVQHCCRHAKYIDSDGDLSCQIPHSSKCCSTFCFIQNCRFKHTGHHKNADMQLYFSSEDELVAELSLVLGNIFASLSFLTPAQLEYTSRLMNNVKSKWKFT